MSAPHHHHHHDEHVYEHNFSPREQPVKHEAFGLLDQQRQYRQHNETDPAVRAPATRPPQLPPPPPESPLSNPQQLRIRSGPYSPPPHIRWIPGDSRTMVQLIQLGEPETAEEIAADELDFEASPELERLRTSLSVDGQNELLFTYGPRGEQVLDRYLPNMGTIHELCKLSAKEFRWLRRRVPDLGVYRFRTLLITFMLRDENEGEQYPHCAANAEYLLRTGVDFLACWSEACARSSVALIRRMLELGADPNAWLNSEAPALVQVLRTMTHETRVQRFQAAKLLLEYRADPNTCVRTEPAQDWQGWVDYRGPLFQSSLRSPLMTEMHEDAGPAVLALLVEANAELDLHPAPPA